MPIYEYECSACGHKFEAIQKFSDALLTDCPECSESELKKLVSAAGFRLKGKGWYETDFKTGKQRNIIGADSSSSDSSDKSDKKAADTKSSNKEKTSSSGESKSSGGSKSAGKSSPSAPSAK